MPKMTMTATETRPSIIVGVGASAGGIHAFQRFLRGVPAKTDAAIVLVMHLDPHRPSSLADALAPSSPLPVEEVSEGMEVRPGHIYVIGANMDLRMEGGKLRPITPRTTGAGRQTIDRFFESLAADAGRRTVGVVLSGTGADGAKGLMAIKKAGGRTFIQDASAEFDSMPHAASEAGAVDDVLPPEKIMHAALQGARAAADPEATSLLEPIVERLLRSSGIDFGRYKPAMIGRRVRRRMALLGVHDLEAYADMIDKQPEELDQLLEDLLINVTAFFRDAKSYGALRKHVFPKIATAGDGSLRVWVPGCSTGEEAYSLALALIEFLEEKSLERPLQVFATDVDEGAIASARAGVYPEAAMKELSQERLQRFFNRRPDGTYEVKRRLRDAVIFARHDLTGDPPFSKLDLVSCRNVLIYLSQDVQRRLMPVFHYALREGGFLSLGPAETVGGSRTLFTEVSKRTHIYRRKMGPAVRPEEGYTFNPPRRKAKGPPSPPPLVTLQEEVDRIRLDLLAPPAIVVDASDRVLLLCGDASTFIVPSPGRPATTVLKMVRDDLQVELDSALTEARAQGARVRRERVPFESKNGLQEVTLDILPLAGPEGAIHLVTFETPPLRPEAVTDEPQSTSEADRLRAALLAQKLHHQLVMHRLELINEELRNTQEEYLASNEEYQSTNEELETAKEELQSSYEELTTVNDQLRVHSQQVAVLLEDLQNIVTALEVPLLIVGPGLEIRRVADPKQQIVQSRPSDIGRSLQDLHIKVPIDLPGIVTSVVRKGKTKQLEVQGEDGRWCQLRITPYTTTDEGQAGAVVALLDVDAQKREALAHERARLLADTILEVSTVPLVLLDAKLAVVRANTSFERLFECEESTLKGQALFKAAKRRWDLPALRIPLERTLSTQRGFQDVEVDAHMPGLGHRVLVASGHLIPAAAGRPEMVVLTLVDETARRAAAEELDALRREQLDRLVQLNHFKAEFIGLAAHELAGPLTPLPVQLKVLESGRLDAPQAKALATVKRNLDAITLMVRDMLLAARFQSGRLDIEKHPIDLAPVVKAVCEDHLPLMEAKGLTFKTELKAVEANADAHHVERVVRNLLSNALKYTDAGGHVEVRLAPDGEEAVLHVKDTGLGLSETALQKLFQPFGRLHAKTSDAPGTGLGLYICNAIVELHGGRMEAESPGPGKGTTFTVRLPVGASQGPSGGGIRLRRQRPTPDPHTRGV